MSTFRWLLPVLVACPTVIAAPDESASADLTEVIVTARKREENQLKVPMSITTFSAETLARLDVRKFDDFATKTPNLSFSYGTAELGIGAVRSLAIRGISGEGTVGSYIDDMPVPGSIDPRVIDVERIEILRGPQGTLFGQGSLGGNVRYLTVAPTLGVSDLRLESRIGATSDGSGPDYALAFAGGRDIGDSLAGRLVGFYDRAAGFLQRRYRNSAGSIVTVNDQGENKTFGGSAAMLWRFAESWDVKFRLLFQRTEVRGWVAPYAPLPDFEVKSLDLDRAVDLQEGTRDRWYLPSLVFEYRSSRFSLTSSTGYFDREVADREDATEGTRWFYYNILGHALPDETPIPWDITIPAHRFSHETRVNFSSDKGLSGVFGVYYMNGSSDERIDGHDLPGISSSGLTSFPGYCPGAPPCPSFGSDLNWYSSYVRDYDDRAFFGEIYYDWRQWQLTLGLRAYEDSQRFRLSTSGAGIGYLVTEGDSRQSGITPKLAISYKPTADAMFYASYAEGFRQGGASPPPTAACGLLDELGLTPGVPPRYNSDSVRDIEIGGKVDFADHRMILTGSVFRMDWDDIQQRVTLPVCYVTMKLNAGEALALGGELELSGKVSSNLEVRAGVGYVDSHVSEQGFGALPEVGSRIVQIPRVTANASATLTKPLGQRLQGFFTADWSHVGDSTSTTAALGQPLSRRSYSLFNASLGVRRDSTEISLYFNNIGDERPNYGDLNPAGYVSHTSLAFSAPIIPRVGTAQPFNAGLQIRHRF